MPTCTQYFVKHWGIDKKNETKFFFKELYNLAERPDKTIQKHFSVLDFMINFFLNLRMNNECSLKYSEGLQCRKYKGIRERMEGERKGVSVREHCSHDQRREQGFP